MWTVGTPRHPSDSSPRVCRPVPTPVHTCRSLLWKDSNGRSPFLDLEKGMDSNAGSFTVGTLPYRISCHSVSYLVFPLPRRAAGWRKVMMQWGCGRRGRHLRKASATVESLTSIASNARSRCCGVPFMTRKLDISARTRRLEKTSNFMAPAIVGCDAYSSTAAMRKRQGRIRMDEDGTASSKAASSRNIALSKQRRTRLTRPKSCQTRIH
ncbi:hypothetical protein DFH07DRAFT_937382 [Mycena maculata]|uniref:Uncharacterized protein n=1 Tax=Mycena maculata TaxID=230809 RepID=A0AAD7NSR3_9AGAR|nr:hypothetical protein DFH07DRAFT_937382 [Mycena maculata]